VQIYILHYKNINKAIKDFTKALKLSPNDVDIYTERGVAYYANKEYNKAMADFIKAI
jgi:Flp pilus assembly protein TadD